MDDLRTVRVGDAKGAGETGGKHSPRELGCSQDGARMEPGWLCRKALGKRNDEHLVGIKITSSST